MPQPTEHPNRRGPKPKANRAEVKSCWITCSILPSDYAALKERVRQEGSNRAEITRKALLAYLQNGNGNGSD